MQLPLQITFRHITSSPALEARIRELAVWLEKFSAQITKCHVIIEPRPRHRHKGGVYAFHIDITLPDAKIAIRRAHRAAQAHEEPYVALRDAFRAARRKVEDYERKRRTDVKTHAPLVHGRHGELD